MKVFKIGMMIMGLILLAGMVIAAPVNDNNGNDKFLNLTQKDASWNPVVGGAYGKLMYKESPKPMFVFNGRGLATGTEYALINYIDPWGSGSNVLGTAMSDNEGNVHITGKTLTFEYRPAKIWLVPTSDITKDGKFTAWNPANYLFETKLI